MLNVARFLARDCQRVTRRSLLQIGACGSLGLSLPGFLAARADAATAASAGRARSVILLWLWGGPSHHETWDPKPDAAAKIRGPFGSIPTRTLGLHISELLPRLAGVSEKYCVIRSMRHDQKDHNVGGTVALTGHVFGAKASGAVPFPGTVRPSMGSLVSWLKSKPAGTAGFQAGPSRQTRVSDLRGEWPPFLAIGPMSKVSGEFVRGQGAGILGAARDPFRFEGDALGDGFKLPDGFTLQADLNVKRLDDRKQLLARIDRVDREFEATSATRRVDEFNAQAMSMLTSPAAKKALDLTSEPAAVRDRYGRTQFGQSCILARRLVESGVPFVQVNWSGDAEDEQQGGDGGWDLHYRLFERMHERYCPIFDRAVPALLADLERRGLLDSTLVLAMGEFGRSPQISSLGGREHWPFGYSMMLAGGGIRGGQVYGSSDRDGGAPNDRPVHPQNIIATTLEALGLNRIALNEMGVGLDAEPVFELF